MKLARFYVPDTALEHDFWLHDEALLARWNQLRYLSGQEIVLFDGVQHDRLYKIETLSSTEAHLLHITDFERKIPLHELYLLWALPESADETYRLLQKGVQRGVTHFIPLVRDNSERFDSHHTEGVLIQASEQAGRSDIPTLREPMNLQTALDELPDQTKLFLAEDLGNLTSHSSGSTGFVLGPQSGWSDTEKKLLKAKRKGVSSS